jgi:hypothetical protein
MTVPITHSGIKNAAADAPLHGAPERIEYQNVLWVLCYGGVGISLSS